MKSVIVQKPLERTRSATPSLHVPLRRLALCLDCEACFDVGTPSCPACSGDTWIPLARFIEQRPDSLGPTRRREAAERAAKQLIVVARGRDDLLEYMKRAFADNASVEVVLDRRRAPRRIVDHPRKPDRRRGDRRLVDIEERLRAVGWAVVRLDVFRARDVPSFNGSR